MSRTFPGLSLLFFLITPAAWAQTPSPPTRAGASYLGSDACQPCHDDIYQTFAESAHQELMENQHPAQHGCESCHGPGSAHVNGNGDASKIFRFQQARAETVRARCGECHQNLMAQDAAHHELSCLACHSAHHYQQRKFLLTLGRNRCVSGVTSRQRWVILQSAGAGPPVPT